MKTNKEVQFQVISTIEFMQKQLGVEVTEDNLLDLIENQLGSYGLEYDDEDVMTIQRGLESRLLIKHTTGISIDNDSEIRDWYSNYDADSEYFWPRYKNYLTRDMKLDPKSIDILENKTLVDLMNYVADPRKDSSEKALRRGLVIGDVQSGKTSTYTGLICKAADAGYNVVILLTGVTETLRKQTQERIEEGVIGRSVKIEKIGGKTQRIIKPVGVGKDNEPSKALSLTSIENDFKTDKTDIILSLKDMNLLVLVIKKNVTVLQRVLDWLKGNNLDPVDNKIHCPMLLIDDEADNASINTKKDLYNPTKTNALIRSLCEIFERTTYIGFTATPFANVFIYPDTEEQMANADLFPEDFIYVLPTPSTYIGAKDIYGNGRYSYWLNMTDDIIEPSFETLDEEFKRGIDKDTRLLYYKHAKTWRGILPNSINDAVCTFILSNAVRILRNDEEQPTTMLINVSRFVDVQNYVKEEIEILLQQIKRFIKFDLSDKLADNERSKVYQALKRNWEEQLAAVSLFLCVAVGEEIMFRGVLFRWIDERWNTTAALVVSALLFGLMHIFNTGATWWSSLAIAVEAGLLLAVAYKWSGTLWLPIGIHWAWNYVQGHVFGLAVSGESVEDTWLSTFVSGPDLLTGGDFGAEASVFSVVLGLALSILIIWRMKHNTIFDNR